MLLASGSQKKHVLFSAQPLPYCVQTAFSKYLGDMDDTKVLANVC